jgi:hypothetical protein
MASKPETITKDIESTEMDRDVTDEAALALKHIDVNDMAPITPEESHRVLRRIDWIMVPIVRICLSSTLTSRWS